MRHVRFEVGRPVPGVRPPVPQGPPFSWHAGGLLRVVYLDRPGAAKVRCVRAAPCAFALAVVPEAPAALFFLYRFGGSAVEWYFAPFAPNYLPEHLRPDLALFPRAQTRLVLPVILGDARTAVVRAIRVTTLSPDFSRALASAACAAALAPWQGDADYDRQLTAAYRRYPTPEALLAVATHRTAGG